MSVTKNTVVECSRNECIETTGELRVSKLSAWYDDKVVLKEVSFALQCGEFVCLCGPNGAGKSTLISVMAGVPDNRLKVIGDIRWFGQTQPPRRREAARTVAYLQQNEYSEWDFTVQDYVLQGRYAYTRYSHYSPEDYAVVDSVLCELGLSDFSQRHIHSLSGGEFQKIRLARALAQTPRFLLLDEPAANLDYVYEPHLMKLLRTTAHSKNIGVLAAVHDINLAATFADKILLLPSAATTAADESSDNSKKSVLFGTPSDIMNTENLKYTFGVDFECKEIKSFQSLL